MSRPENRSQLMKHFGAKQKNVHWSWCAINEKEKSVYFSVWTDFRNKYGDKGRNYYTIQGPDWGIDKETGSSSPARIDQDEKLDKVLNQDYEAFCYFIEAKDKNAPVREIESTRTTFVFSLELERLDDGTVIGYPLERIDVR